MLYPLSYRRDAATVVAVVPGSTFARTSYSPEIYAIAPDGSASRLTPELLARIEALARRSHPPVSPVLSRSGIVLDSSRHEAHRGSTVLDLTNKEFGVLEVLLAAQGRVVSSEELLERVWDEHTDPFTTVVDPSGRCTCTVARSSSRSATRWRSSTAASRQKRAVR